MCFFMKLRIIGHYCRMIIEYFEYKTWGMIKKLLFVQLFVLIFIAVNAQENAVKKRNLTIKLPLSSLAGDLYGESVGFGLGIEKMINPSFSLSQELNYIFHVDDNTTFRERLESMNGIKLTTEARRYLNKNEIPESGLFASAELKNIWTQSIEKNGGVENNITRYRGQLSANIGYLVYWDKHKNSRITLELLVGGGLGYVNANSSVNTESLVESKYNANNKIYPCINFDIKIGFILNP